jgi:hypothetical protein
MAPLSFRALVLTVFEGNAKWTDFKTRRIMGDFPYPNPEYLLQTIEKDLDDKEFKKDWGMFWIQANFSLARRIFELTSAYAKPDLSEANEAFACYFSNKKNDPTDKSKIEAALRHLRADLVTELLSTKIEATDEFRIFLSYYYFLTRTFLPRCHWCSAHIDSHKCDCHFSLTFCSLSCVKKSKHECPE